MKRTITSIIFMIAAAAAWGQALPFAAISTDPTVLAKGGSSLTVASGLSAATDGNPASIPFDEKTLDASVSYAMWQPQGISRNIIGAGTFWNIRRKFGAAIGFSRASGQEYQIIDGNGVWKGSFKTSDMKFGVGLAYRPIDILSIGANVGYARERLAEDASYGSINADIYVMLKIKDFKAAAGISEAFGKVTSASGKEFPLPSAFNLGIGYGIHAGERHMIEAEADVRYFFSDGITASAGGEYTYNDLLSVRAGYRYGGSSFIPSYASVGAGVKLSGIRIDLAYLISSGAMSNTIALSAGYCF